MEHSMDNETDEAEGRDDLAILNQPTKCEGQKTSDISMTPFQSARYALTKPFQCYCEDHLTSKYLEMEEKPSNNRESKAINTFEYELDPSLSIFGTNNLFDSSKSSANINISTIPELMSTYGKKSATYTGLVGSRKGYTTDCSCCSNCTPGRSIPQSRPCSAKDCRNQHEKNSVQMKKKKKKTKFLSVYLDEYSPTNFHNFIKCLCCGKRKLALCKSSYGSVTNRKSGVSQIKNTRKKSNNSRGKKCSNCKSCTPGLSFHITLPKVTKSALFSGNQPPIKSNKNKKKKNHHKTVENEAETSSTNKLRDQSAVLRNTDPQTISSKIETSTLTTRKEEDQELKGVPSDTNKSSITLLRPEKQASSLPADVKISIDSTNAQNSMKKTPHKPNGTTFKQKRDLIKPIDPNCSFFERLKESIVKDLKEFIVAELKASNTSPNNHDDQCCGVDYIRECGCDRNLVPICENSFESHQSENLRYKKTESQFGHNEHSQIEIAGLKPDCDDAMSGMECNVPKKSKQMVEEEQMIHIGCQCEIPKRKSNKRTKSTMFDGQVVSSVRVTTKEINTEQQTSEEKVLDPEEVQPNELRQSSSRVTFTIGPSTMNLGSRTSNTRKEDEPNMKYKTRRCCICDHDEDAALEIGSYDICPCSSSEDTNTENSEIEENSSISSFPLLKDEMNQPHEERNMKTKHESRSTEKSLKKHSSDEFELWQSSYPELENFHVQRPEDEHERTRKQDLVACNGEDFEQLLAEMDNYCKNKWTSSHLPQTQVSFSKVENIGKFHHNNTMKETPIYAFHKVNCKPHCSSKSEKIPPILQSDSSLTIDAKMSVISSKRIGTLKTDLKPKQSTIETENEIIKWVPPRKTSSKFSDQRLNRKSRVESYFKYLTLKIKII